MNLDFKSGEELLALCKEKGCPISAVMRSREEEAENIRMYIQPDEWDIHPFEWLVSYKYQLNYMVYCTVVMKDGTEYEAYYFPHDDAFSLFGKDGFYAAKHTTVFKK